MSVEAGDTSGYVGGCSVETNIIEVGAIPSIGELGEGDGDGKKSGGFLSVDGGEGTFKGQRRHE